METLLLENGEPIGTDIKLFMITKSIVNKDGAIITSTFKFYATEEIIMMSPRGKDEVTSNRPSSVLLVYV